MIKISVIVPVYNNGKYLEKCLNSIINQSLREIEIICINDGSTDNSLDILKKYSEKDKRIIIIDKKNSGSSESRNIGIEMAKGEYCLNVDSDDWIENNCLYTLYEKARKLKLDILINDIYLVYKNKNIILEDLKLDDFQIISGEEYIKIFLEKNYHGYSCNKLIKRDLYIKNKIMYNKEIFSGEDIECLIRLAFYAKKIGKINKPYYYYRQGENNGNKKIKLKYLKDSFRVFESLEEFYKKKSTEILKKLKNRKYPILLSKTLRYYEYYSQNIEYQNLKQKIILEIQKDKEFKIKYVNKKDFFKKDRIILILIKNNYINSEILFIIFNYLKRLKKGIIK